MVLRIAVISIDNSEQRRVLLDKKWHFFARPPCQETLFASAGSARAKEKNAFFMHAHTRFYKENDTTQPNTDRLRRPWSRAHTSLAHSSLCVAIQQGAPRRTGRRWPGGRFCSPGPPAARNHQPATRRHKTQAGQPTCMPAQRARCA